MKSMLAVAAGAALLGCASPKPVVQAPRSESIESRVAERVAPLVRDRWVFALAIALVDDKSTHFVSLGGARPGVPTTPDTRFELGSVSKTFTSLALATMVEDHTITLDTEIRALLPADVTVPFRDRAITLLDLATHTSGLPRLPTNLDVTDPGDPYAHYDASKLYAFLGSYALPRTPGETYEYSNLGAGLLGHVLARKVGGTYETMLRTRVLDPLGMTETTMDDVGLAVGHDADGTEVGAWHLAALAGAGQVRSTARDMAKYVQAQLGLRPSALASAITLSHQGRHDLGEGGAGQIALGWHVRSTGLLWHNGGTGGSHSFVAFDPKRCVGVVVLATGATSVVDRVGLDLLGILRGDQPGPSPIPETVHLDPAALDEYVGTYRVSPTFAIVITRNGDTLAIQATGQPRFGLYASAVDDFYLRVVDAKIRFVREAGVITGLVLSQDGKDIPAKRI